MGDLGDAARRAGSQAGDGIGDGGEQGGRRFRSAISEAAQAAQRALDGLADRSVLPERLGNIGRSAATKLAGALKAGLAGVGISVGAGLAATLGAGLNRLVTIDTARTKLMALGNSAENVEKIMKNANAAVKGTAYGMGDAATIAASAVAAGIEPGKQLEKYLRSTADAASIAGMDIADMGSIMNQVQTNGVAMTDSFQQLADAGLPVFTWLSEATGKTGEDLQDFISEGGVSAQMFQDLIANKLGGAAKTMGTSVAGGFANMKAAMGRFGAALIGPFFSQSGSVLSSITTMFDGMTTGATAAMTRVNDYIMNTLVPGIGGAITKFQQFGQSSGMFDRLRNIFQQLAGIGGQLWPAIMQIAGSLGQASAAIGISSFQIFLMLLQALLPVISMLVGWIANLADWMSRNQGIVTVLVGAYTAYRMAILAAKAAQMGIAITTGIITGLQGTASVAIAGNTAAIRANAIAAKASMLAQKAWTGVMMLSRLPTLAAAAAQWALNSALLANPITWIIIAIVALVAAIVLIATKTTWFQTAWSWAWDKIKGAASAVWGFLQPIFSAIGDAFKWLWESVISPVIDFIVGAFKLWWEGVQLYFRLVVALFQVLGEAFSRLWSYVIQPILGFIGQGFQFLWAGLQVVFGWIKTGLEFLWDGLSWAYTTIVQPVLGFIGAAFQLLWNGLTIVFGWIRGGINAAFAVLNWVWTNIVSPILGFIGGAFSRLYNAVIAPVIGFIRARFNDFVTGIQVIWNAARNVVSNVTGKFQELMGFFGGIGRKIIGMFSGAGKWLWDSGKNIVQGLLNGAGSLLSKIGEFFLDKIPGWIKGPFKSALGINSPSKLFATYGQNIGQGLIAGVRGMSGNVQSATQDLANSAANISMPTVEGATVAAPTMEAATVASAPIDAGAAGGTAAAGATAVGEGWQTAADSMTSIATGLIDPTMQGLQQGVLDYGLNTQTQLSTVVTPAWSMAATNLMTTKLGLLDPTMAGIQGMTNLTAGVTANSVYGVMNPAWQNMGSNVAAVFNGSVNPIMGAMRGAVANTAAAFGVGASNIANQWNRVREATASPVRFAIGAVFNDGIVGMWNSVSDLLGTTKMSPYPIRFATGGSVPGSGNGDTVPALLTPKEFVVPRGMAAAIGGGNLDRGLSMLDSVRKRGPQSGMGPEGLFSAVAGRYAGGGPVKGSPAWNAVKRGMGFAAKYNGRPYVWGGSLGPNGGTDCSGYMSSIADVILGGSGMSRKWATGAFPGGGGSQAGSANAGGQLWNAGLRAGMSIGVSTVHTAGTIGGFAGLPAVNIESGGSHGNVAYGGPAVGADHSQFPSRYHLPIVNEMFISAGANGGQDMGSLVGAITGDAWRKIMANATGWKGGGHIGQYPGKLATKMKAVTQAKIDKLLEEMMADPGGAGAERWRPMAMRAMMRTGFNARDKAQVDAMISQIQSESGGNPGIAQQIHDVNGSGESAGVGLLQIIPGTWAAFRDPALPDDRRNPFANMVGALRYYKSRYGMDLTQVWGHGHGYDLGGLATKEGLLPKHINVPERVLSPAQTRAFEAWMDAGAFSGDTIVMADENMSDLSSRIMDEMRNQGFSDSADYTFSADGRTRGGSGRTVMVNQYISGGDSQETADEVERRLLKLI